MARLQRDSAFPRRLGSILALFVTVSYASGVGSSTIAPLLPIARSRQLVTSASPSTNSSSAPSSTANATVTSSASQTATPSVTPTASLSPGASPSTTPSPTTTSSASPSPSVSPGTIFSEKGCACVRPCEDSFDSTRQWCFTSEQGVDPPPATGVIVLIPNADPSPGAATDVTVEDPPCGFYSSTRAAYWDYACTNATVLPQQLTTASELWVTVIESAVVTAVAVYSVFGVLLARRVALSLGAPIAALGACVGLVAYGALATFAIAGVITVPLAQVYLAMPYAVPADVAVSIGLSLGLTAAYFHMGQHMESLRPFADT